MNNHPTDEALLSWVTGEMQGDSALALESHVIECSVCATRLADEAALDAVMLAAGQLHDEVAVVELAQFERPAATQNGWRQGLAVAAGFALILFAGRGSFGEDHVDSIEPGPSARPAVVIGSAPATWEDGPASEDCELLATPGDGDEPTCANPSSGLVAMADLDSPAPWSISSDTGGGDNEPCTTPVDTGDSLTCDDWLSADDLSG